MEENVQLLKEFSVPYVEHEKWSKSELVYVVLIFQRYSSGEIKAVILYIIMIFGYVIIGTLTSIFRVSHLFTSYRCFFIIQITKWRPLPIITIL